MSFLNKTYTVYKDENFKDFMKSLGFPDEKIQVLLNYKASQSMKKDGDQYTLSTTTPDGGNKEIIFKDGVEFDEEIYPGVVGKSKFTVDGNVVTQTQKFGEDLSLVYKREFSDDELVVVITSSKWAGTAYRYFKAS